MYLSHTHIIKTKNHIYRKGVECNTPSKKILKYQFIPNNVFCILSTKFNNKMSERRNALNMNNCTNLVHVHYVATNIYHWWHDIDSICVLPENQNHNLNEPEVVPWRDENYSVDFYDKTVDHITWVTPVAAKMIDNIKFTMVVCDQNFSCNKI